MDIQIDSSFFMVGSGHVRTPIHKDVCVCVNVYAGSKDITWHKVYNSFYSTIEIALHSWIFGYTALLSLALATITKKVKSVKATLRHSAANWN